jgi:hypothetical protein
VDDAVVGERDELVALFGCVGLNVIVGVRDGTSLNNVDVTLVVFVVFNGISSFPVAFVDSDVMKSVALKSVTLKSVEFAGSVVVGKSRPSSAITFANVLLSASSVRL